jgi:Fibronectin type III domain/Pentapeptide repeats (8 copies)
MDGWVARARRRMARSSDNDALRMPETGEGSALWISGVLRPVIIALAAMALAVALATPAASAKTPRLKKPSAPTGVTAQPIEQGAVVSWSVPTSDGGSPITGYTVTVGTGSKEESCSTTTQLTCTVTGLMNGRRHKATVRAVNALGAGRPGVSEEFVTGQSPDCSNFTPGADLQYCDFHNATLSGFDLAGADFWGAKLTGATFVNSNLDNALFGGDTGAEAQLTDVWFTNDEMVGTSLNDLYIYATNFDSGTDLTNADFSGSVVLADNFDHVNLTGADLIDSLLQYPSFTDSTCPDGTNSDSDGGTCVNDL